MAHPSSPKIIRSNTEFHDAFTSLARGDIVVGRLRLKPTEESILLDLAERSIQLIPSGISQLLCRSKAFQTQIFSEYMAPLTTVIHDIHGLTEAMAVYAQGGVKRIVVKLDRKNAGQGVFSWDNVETLFTHASLGLVPYPFVLQPFIDDCADLRIIILGGYVEAYARRNPYNFRKNMHFGGTSEKVRPSGEQLELCGKIMARGKFPYAHIDLLVEPGGRMFFSEINLRGGIRGAAISPNEYIARLAAIHEQLLRDILENNG